ncbi:MAG: hypothetical protein LBR39_03850 [Coriobacteriales bacterium]|jgi:hypothetical protein|nr:hypothetical protein [Coriobacteriales bacterium]
MQQSDEFGTLQRLVDYLYKQRRSVARLDVLLAAEMFDISGDLLEIVELLPPGSYSRQKLCDQLNSALAAHGWGLVYGTVD